MPFKILAATVSTDVYVSSIESDTNVLPSLMLLAPLACPLSIGLPIGSPVFFSCGSRELTLPVTTSCEALSLVSRLLTFPPGMARPALVLSPAVLILVESNCLVFLSSVSRDLTLRSILSSPCLFISPAVSILLPIMLKPESIFSC